MVVRKIHTDALLTFVFLHFATFADPKELQYLPIYLYIGRFVKVKEYYILKPRNLTGAQAPLAPLWICHCNVEKMYMRVNPLMGQDLMKTRAEMTFGRNTPSFEVRQIMYEHRNK